MKDSRSSRLILLAGFLVIILLIYLGVLYDTQVTDHADYLARSLHSIAREETIEASRGIITDRKGRPLVSNRSAYNLTFDVNLLSENDDQNLAIARLLALCRQQNRKWVDTLPISLHSPYVYTLDNVSATQKGRFLSYLKSLKGTHQLLGSYLMEHPELVEAPDTAASGEATAEETALSPEKQAAALVERLSPDTLTEDFLKEAGLDAETVLSLMREDMKLPAAFSRVQARQVLGVRYELAMRKLGDHSSYVLVEDIDTAFISLITDGKYAGAKVTASSVRQYETKYAAHILGTVSPLYATDLDNPLYDGYPLNAIVGREGAEAAFEQYLQGKNGRRIVSTNNEGKITGEYYTTEPEPGGTVELTIDLNLQKAVEDALARTVESMNSEDGRNDRGAGAVVELVDSGEILALASYPTYDLSSYRQDFSALDGDPAAPLFNRASQGTYPPGSTLKPLTAVAALEEEEITATQKIRDTGRWIYPNDPTGSGAWCWNRGGHGLVNVIQAITVSCNYFFAEMGYRLGMDTFRSYLTAFGLGEHSGIETGDNPGTLPENKTGENQTPWAAFGQANQLYSPIQLANYIATLVSGGERREAHLLKSVKSYDSAEVLAEGNTSPVATVPLKESTLTAVKEGMHNLTTTGSLAYYFKDCVVSAGAKTGTAQLGTGITNNGVFVCFAPYDDPEIAVSIVIEKGGSGAALASTAVEILNAYFTPTEVGIGVIGENQLLP